MTGRVFSSTKAEIAVKRRLTEQERIQRWRDQLGLAPNATGEAFLNKEFREAYDHAVEDFFFLRLPLVFDTLYQKALSGDLKAIELFLSRFDPAYQRIKSGIAGRLEPERPDDVGPRLQEIIKRLKANGVAWNPPQLKKSDN